ncbi:WD40/YVTN/BNR-like repeat-containing protein [Streptomyces sp. NPDC054796]
MTVRRLVAVALCGAAVCAALGSGQAVAGAAGAPIPSGPSGPSGEGADSVAWGGRDSRGGLSWSLKDSGSEARFRGLAAVSRSTAWLAGSGGTVLRTRDGGTRWTDVSPPGAEDLEFRDVEAFGPDRAVVLAIGEGEASRVFRTDDGGATWKETFRNDEPSAFYNCLTFFDRSHGLAVSDPVDGAFRVLGTRDGGRSWRVLPSDGMPEALPGEANFAASGQCLVTAERAGGQGRGTRSGDDVWMASGGGATARIYHSADRGRNWTVSEAPVPAGHSARGVFGLAFTGQGHGYGHGHEHGHGYGHGGAGRVRGLAVGGDYRAGEHSPDASAVSRDGGATWRASDRPVPAYRSGVAWLPGTRSAALAVGPTGTDLSLDAGRTWHTVDGGSYDTVDCAGSARACWAAGEKGRVARLEPGASGAPSRD